MSEASQSNPVFNVRDIDAQREANGKAYLEFIRSAALSTGLYVLPAGATDPQQPHTEDEVYYVVSGQAVLKIAEQDYPVETGSVMFVPAQVEHRFHSIQADLTVLVFFAPAEYSNQ